MEIMHWGSTYRTDIGFNLQVKHGFYFTAGKLDGGINFRSLSKWYLSNTARRWEWRFGPFDLMWIKGKDA